MNQTDRELVGGVTFYARGVKKIYVADFWTNGEHCRKSLKTTNKKAARDRAVQLAAELSQGHYRPAPVAVGFEDAYEAYLMYLKTENRAKKTLTKYRGVFENFATFLGTIRVAKLGQVTATHFDKYRAGRAETRHPKTRYTEGVILKQLFRWAKTRKLIHDNPLVDVKLHKPRSGSKPTLSLDQVDRILASAKLPLRTYLSVLAFTGIRSGELRRLRLEDVDLAGGWVHVRSRPGEETKTRRERKLPVHPRLWLILESARKGSGTYLFTVGPSRKYPAGGPST
jgi:integrase